MEAIKNLIYLDEYKMYSISSQLFGGLTEHVTNVEHSGAQQDERQGGPFGSGRTLANILKSGTSIEERRFLHDFSYTLFETALYDEGKVVNVSTLDDHGVPDAVSSASFVAVRGRMVFNDMQAIDTIVSNFNKIGEALSYVIGFGANGGPPPDPEGTSGRGGNKQRVRIQEAERKRKMREFAQNAGMYFDPTFLEQLRVILEYGYKDRFEAHIDVGSYTFSAPLQRGHFREPEDLVVKKYSRFSEQEFVLFGTVAQGIGGNTPARAIGDGVDLNREADVDAEPSGDLSMKESILVLLEQLHVLETVLSGKKENEVVIDPIALYREL